MNRLQPKRVRLLAALFLFLSIQGRTQDDARSFALFEDKSKTLRSDEVLALYQAHKFSPAPAGQKNIGFTRSVFWLAFPVASALPKDSLVLHIGDPHINTIQVYQAQRRQATLLYTTGDYYPFKQRPLPTTGFYFPVQGSGIYLVRVDKSNESLQLHFGLRPYMQVLLEESSHTAVIGFLSGIIFLLILFGAYLFLLTRDRVYLLYGLYILSGWMWVVGNSGHGFQYIWPDSPWFASKASPVFSLITLGLSFHIMLHYIGERNQKRLRWLVNALTTIVLTLAL
ncbi:MAG: signal transduction histidine kinase, partial [Flaviaesturariibacter sp.]|nr:signal transduction histidine kinase [Flaviaesturariibacter sp.]